MSSFRQIEANRRNAQMSAGPVTEEGKRRSRQNAIRHGLTAETVIDALEDAEDYAAFEMSVASDYDAQSAVERELVLRLVSGEATSITAAAEKAGLSHEHLSRELGRPHIAEHLRSKVLRNLAINAAKAGATKVKLLDSKNGMVADRASSFILGLAGISPQTAPVAAPGPQTAGVVIQIISREEAAPRPTVDVTPAPIEIIHS